MKNTNRLSYKILSVVIALAVLFCSIPLGVFTVSAAPASTSIADAPTLDNWKHWFPDNNTRYAGGVYVDKSVFTASDATAYYANDIADKLNFGTDNFGNENFLVSLSAIGSNTEVKGYSTTPTDTMLVLDLSNSMGSDEMSALVQSTNNAIDSLLSLNRHNRVGVVLYSGNNNTSYDALVSSATVLLPLNRYETTVTERINEGTYWNPSYVTRNIYVQYSNDNVRIATENNGGVRVEGTTNYITKSKRAEGSTYIQNGLYQAWQEFSKVTDTTIPDGQLQGGTKRMPIMVLMSDGAPTVGTENYYNVGTSDTGNGSSESVRLTFLTQLTAAWAKAKIANKYEISTDDVKFYTLGLGTSSSTYATDVLNPSSANAMGDVIDYWDDFIAGSRNQNGEVGIEVRNNQYWYIPKEANSVLTNANQRKYVTQYWSAENADGLI
ncbi:MAG: VWA domain-containing protein, partial [Clostridia bacterium]|nr:VWA domain-containing protein [Clostridia bacterium]